MQQIPTTICNMRRCGTQRFVCRVRSLSDRQTVGRKPQVQRTLGTSQRPMPTLSRTLQLHHKAWTVPHGSFPAMESTVRRRSTCTACSDSPKRASRTNVIWGDG